MTTAVVDLFANTQPRRHALLEAVLEAVEKSIAELGAFTYRDVFDRVNTEGIRGAFLYGSAVEQVLGRLEGHGLIRRCGTSTPPQPRMWETTS